MEKKQPASDRSREIRRIMVFLIIQMILLVVQFVTGIVENKYPLTSTFELFGINYLTIELLIHVGVGFIIVIVGIVMLYLSYHMHDRTLMIMNVIAPVFAGLAIHAGATFFLNGLDPLYSVWMAICYITVFVIYCSEAHRSVLIKKAVQIT